MKSKILFVLCLLTGLMFINAGLNKFFHYMPMPKDTPKATMDAMKAYMAISWLMPLVGAAEVVGGLFLIIPRLRPLGTLILTPILVGIICANVSMNPSTLPITLVMTAVVVWAIIDKKDKYLPLLSK